MENEIFDKFIKAQDVWYNQALAEVRKGKKESHWMWFIFPQLKGLGKSSTSNFYSIQNKKEAVSYLNHPILGENLIEISTTLLHVNNKTAFEIFGTPDYLKLKSCMTLFKAVALENLVFEQVLQKYYFGDDDKMTLDLLNDEKNNTNFFSIINLTS